jgi:hypothetical protein
MSRILYGIEDAAAQVSVDTKTLRRAIQATDPTAFPPPLVGAKRNGSGKNAKYLIPHDALVAWAALLPDA